MTAKLSPLPLLPILLLPLLRSHQLSLEMLGKVTDDLCPQAAHPASLLSPPPQAVCPSSLGFLSLHTTGTWGHFVILCTPSLYPLDAISTLSSL